MTESGCFLTSATVPDATISSAPDPCPRADVDDVIGARDRLLVVLDDDDRVALGAKAGEGVEQHAVVARVQPDRRLVEHVADTAEVAAELGG